MPTPHTKLSATLQSWFDRGRLEHLGGLSTFTLEAGDPARPTLVLIHGFPTSSWDFVKIWPQLSKRFRLITLDMHGFGFSAKPNARTYSIHKQADLFAELLQDRGVREFHILAHDYGVSVAQELLARQSEGELTARCLSCCFLNGGLFPETHKALLVQKLLLGPLGKIVNGLTGYGLFKKSFGKVFGEKTKPSNAELHGFWEAINYNDGKHLFHNLITYMSDRRQHRQRWLSPMQGSSIPLALINGSVDPVSGAHLVTRYKELGCRLDYLKELPEIGHYPHTEAPDAVVTAYLAFIETCDLQS